MAEIFISYKKTDKDRIQPLIERLEAVGFTVWWDYAIETGEDWFDAILREIDISRCVIGIWSRNSVTSDGRFIPNQHGMQYVAIEHRRSPKKLVPVQLDQSYMPDEYSNFQAADLSNWNGDSDSDEWLKLIERVDALITPTRIRTRLDSLFHQLNEEKMKRQAAQQRLVEVNDLRAREMKSNADSVAIVQVLENQIKNYKEKDTSLSSQIAELKDQLNKERKDSRGKIRRLQNKIEEKNIELTSFSTSFERHSSKEEIDLIERLGSFKDTISTNYRELLKSKPADYFIYFNVAIAIFIFIFSIVGILNWILY